MPYHILIINPNSNTSMTDSLRAPIDSLNYNDTTYTYFTAPPPSPYSINSLPDAAASTRASLPSLLPLLHTSSPEHPPQFDAILVACYSPHPLVQELQRAVIPRIPVVGIFEASVSVAVQLLSSSFAVDTATEEEVEGIGVEEKKMEKRRKFGIVSTGEQWGGILSDAITSLPSSSTNGIASASASALGPELANAVFAGVETLGVDAGDLHPTTADSESQTLVKDSGKGGEEGGGEESVEAKVKAATRRLLDRGEEGEEVGVVVLGCAGMVGMEGWVREEVAEVEGRRGGGKGKGVRVVDGVKAGVGVLQGLVRGGY
ncbi:MAG: hypothetical protein Q9219_003330 [cf. Caloplaca sp. 3 TL-2023]